MYKDIGKKLKKEYADRIKKDFHLKEEETEKGPEGEAPDFAQAIKKLRGQSEWSLEKLAEVTGIKKQTLHSLENYSIRNPSFPNLEKIAAAFGVGVTDLWNMARGEFRGNLFKTTAAQRWLVSFESEKGFTLNAYSPPAMSQRDFFVGVMHIGAGKKLRHWKMEGRAKACIQVWDGDILFIYHGMNWRREERVLANETLYYDASIPHTFENLADHQARVLLVTYPSFF